MQKRKNTWKQVTIWGGVGVICGVVVLAGVLRMSWKGQYLPGVRVGGVELAGMSREEGVAAIRQAGEEYEFKLSFNGNEWPVPRELGLIQIEESAARAYRIGRRWQIDDYARVITGNPIELTMVAGVDEAAMNEWVDEISPIVEIAPIQARAEIAGNEIKIINGSDGVIVDREQLRRLIETKTRNLDREKVEVPLRMVTKQLTETELEELRTKAQGLVGDRLEIRLDDEKIWVNQAVLVSWLGDEAAKRKYADSLTTLLNREPQDAKFVFEGGRVREFAPARDGVAVEVEETVARLEEAYDKLVTGSESETVQVVVKRTPPAISTESANELGIVERIGRGESYYAHSIANRIYNVGLAAGRVSGILLAPGEEFSFNKLVGEISAATGYKTAYVISGGRTVLGDGGGVCQVSTTLFRAVMNAGLPITERWAHAYRVGYYEQNSDPGIDATVYNPSKDFKFVNDTPAHVLIQAINEPAKQHLVYEIYGTKDGRVATLSKPVVTGQSPPPPDIYEDDPNMPEGQVKQVDWAAWGARTSFEYRVEKDGATLFEKTYVSNYRPWANVYMRGTLAISQ